MEIKYTAGIGEIGEILRGETERVDSLDDLDLNDSPGIIITPKIIGIYQQGDEKDAEIDNISNQIYQMGIFIKTGKREKIFPDLICIGYDSTIIPKEVLERALESDVLNRSKSIEHYNLPDLSEFYNKDSQIKKRFEIFRKTLKNPSSKNMSLLDRTKNHLELLRQDYGLTRAEAIELLIMGKTLSYFKGDPEIIDDPSLLKRIMSDKNLFKDF
ncbi:MAG: hypothetical protein ACTSRT_21565 [Promethearchaeota archaeon]